MEFERKLTRAVSHMRKTGKHDNCTYLAIVEAIMRLLVNW